MRGQALAMGKKLGGKMDDITVVVGAVVATDSAKEDIAAAEKVSAKLQTTADQAWGRREGRRCPYHSHLTCHMY